MGAPRVRQVYAYPASGGRAHAQHGALTYVLDLGRGRGAVSFADGYTLRVGSLSCARRLAAQVGAELDPAARLMTLRLAN